MKKKYIPSLLLVGVLFLNGCASFTDFFNRTNDSLYIVSEPNITSFNVGDAFDSEGLSVISLGTREEVYDYTLSPSDGYVFTLSDVGEKTINVTHSQYKGTSFTVSVTNLAALVISSLPQTEYQVGDVFSLDGLVVTSGGEEVTDYSVSYSNGRILDQAGTFKVFVSKTGYASVYFTITVTEAQELRIKTSPTKTTYNRGDAFSSAGLVVEDQNGQIVTGYNVSIEEGDILKYAKSINVEVSKEGYHSTSFTISVNDYHGSDSIEKDLTIYYINDTHGSFIRQVDGSSYEAGMSYIGKYIMDRVNANPNTSLVLSGGDMFQGGYESNLTQGAIMIDAMNIIGFDAMVLGNHEFDWKESTIGSFASGLNCPIISCNTFYLDDSRPEWVEPYTIVEKGDIRVGIIGADEENIGRSITGSISNSFSFPDPTGIIKEYSDLLRLTYNCDIILAAFHDGGFEGYDGEPTKYSSLTENSLVSGAKYVDAMFFSHDHLRKEGKLNDVPFIESGCNGRNIGELTLNIESDSISYSVENSSTNNVWAYTTCKTSSPLIDALSSKEEYQDIITHADDVVYTFKKSYTQEEFTTVVCMAMYWYVNTNKEDFDNLTFYFANHNVGGVRAAVSAGEFTNRNFIKVFPFDNYLSLQRCTSKHINKLENDSYYGTYKNGDIVYDDSGLTNSISINFITEKTYAYQYQSSYKNYDCTAREALVAYIKSGVNNTL